jgi:glycosyltransferase involved in cell wall biosynthesis
MTASSTKVSIAMGCYRRPAQLRNTLVSIRKQTIPVHQIVVTDDGLNPDNEQTELICKEFGAEYYLRPNRPADVLANSSIALNISIKRATGDILIIQCPECKYEDREGIQKMVAPIIENPLVTTFPRVQALHENGHSFITWFIHETHNPRYLNFCQALRTDLAIKIGGFDQRMQGPGWDDDDFEQRLFAHGAIPVRVDTLVSHQWHQGWARGTEWWNKALYEGTMDRIIRGEKPVANEGVTWGNIYD